MASYSELDISLNIQSNRDYDQLFAIMGNYNNLLDTVNNAREYRYDLSGLDLPIGEDFLITENPDISIKYKTNFDTLFLIFNRNLEGDNTNYTPKNIALTLNFLRIGFFNSYIELGTPFIGTYNDNYVFGDLDLGGFLSTESGDPLIGG